MYRKRLVFVNSTFPKLYKALMFFIIILVMMTVQTKGYMESAEFISDLDRPGKLSF